MKPICFFLDQLDSIGGGLVALALARICNDSAQFAAKMAFWRGAQAATTFGLVGLKMLREQHLWRAMKSIPDRIRTCNLRLRSPTGTLSYPTLGYVWSGKTWPCGCFCVAQCSPA